MNDEFLALHGLVVKKTGGPDEVASLTGQPPEVVARVLDDAVRAGRAAAAGGKYLLTPEGRAHLDRCYPSECADLRADDGLHAAYERFEPVNRRLLALFTRWQMMDTPAGTVPNDHSDPDYDAALVDQLGDAHERFEPIAAAMTRALPRFTRYRERLDDAYDKVLAGNHEYVSGARVDSYHTVWFEMHEDLLRLLGRTREDT